MPAPILRQPSSSPPPRAWRAGTWFLVLALVVTLGAGAPRPAQAAIPTFVTSIGTDIWTSIQTIYDKLDRAYKDIKDEKRNWTYTAGAVAFKKALTAFLSQLAHDSAKWIASGGKGEQPLFIEEGWGAYLTNAADNAAGEIIDSLSEPGGFLNGFNICQPNLDIALRVQLGLNRFTPSRPQCTFSKLRQRWDQAIARADFLPNFQRSFAPGENDLGIALTLNANLIQQVEEAKYKATAERLTSPFKPIVDFAENILTPGDTVRETLYDAFPANRTNEAVFVGDILADALDVFTNTLAGQFINNFIQKGLGGSSSSRRPRAQPTLTNPTAQVVPEGVRGAQIRLAQDIAPSFNIGGRYQVLQELVSCPKPNAPAPNGCAITDKFRTAIDQRLTVREAVAKGLINGDAPFGFVGWNPQPVEPGYTDGVPYRTILILRKYRIVPVGWELAARYLQHFDQKRRTIAELLDLYSVKELGVGQRNPYYHLVDPDWVLVAPDAYCKLQGVGPEVISALVAQGVDGNKDGKFDGPDEVPPSVQVTRGDKYCADEQTCIEKDAKGGCKFYGYCTEEKRTWNFGAAACQPTYNTCATLSNQQTGETVSYLLNSVDFGRCDEQSAGCRQYGRTRNPRATTVVQAWNQGDTIHLNARAAACDAVNAGCRAYLRTGFGLGAPDRPQTNLLRNPSFEAVPGASVPGWVGQVTPPVGLSVASVKTDGGADGTNYFAFGTDTTVEQRIEAAIPVSGMPLAVSFAIRGGAPNVAPTVTVKDGTSGAGLVTFAFPASFSTTSEWQRASAAAVLPATASGTAFTLSFDMAGLGLTQLDAVKLEAGEQPSAYLDYGAGAVHLKRAPEELGCRPSKSADQNPPEPSKAECQPYARACLAEEVGCQSYTPKLGGAPVTSVRADACPAECAGFDAYTQAATFFEGTKFADLIPRTGRRCAAAAVGCDEFTNLDVAASGGEGKEYYQQLRYCQKPGGRDDGTFYTWEGSDTTGYQLRVFSLKATNVTTASVANVPAAAGDASTAPCTRIALRANGSSQCIDGDGASTVTVDGVPVTTQTPSFCLPGDVGANPDCRQFYDPTGAITYRLLPETISVTDDCRPYRKSSSTPADCQQSNGYWDATASACLYQVAPKEGRSCSAAAAGCREYHGGTAANYRALFLDTYERGAGGWSGGSLSPVASTVGGHSYAVPISGTAVARKSLAVTSGNPITRAAYVLSFWARRQAYPAGQLAVAGATVDLVITNPAGAAVTEHLIAGPGIEIGPEWQFFQSDPLAVDDIGAAELQVKLAGAGPVYLDNVELKSNTSTAYLIKGSSTVPASCTDPVSVLGCQTFTDSASRSRNIWQFGPSCSPAVVGCEAVIDTQNSTAGPDAPFARPYPEEGVTVPEDRVDFLVNDPQKQCGREVQGCAALGVPVRAGADQQITGWQGACSNDRRRSCATDADCPAGGTCLATPTYLIDNPDRYADTLCRPDQRECSAYQTKGNQALYFKNPGKQTCEYRENVPVPGWYWTGNVCSTTDATRCTDDRDCPAGERCGAAATPNCGRTDGTTPRTLAAAGVPEPAGGWAGLCPAEQSSCTEFVDPRSDTQRTTLYNGSFLLRTDVDRPPDGWADAAGAEAIKAYDPSRGLRVGIGTNAAGSVADGLRQTVRLVGRTLYNLSAEVFKDPDTPDSAPAFLGVRNCHLPNVSEPLPGFSSCSNADAPPRDGRVSQQEVRQAVTNAARGCQGAPCLGDLNGDNRVTSDEVAEMTNFSLNGLDSCRTGLRSPDRSMLVVNYAPSPAEDYGTGTFLTLASNQADQPDRLSGRFYAMTPGEYVCDVVIGTAGILPDGATSPTIASDPSAPGQWFRKVALAPAGLYYQLADRVNRSDCNGTVGPGCALFDERAVSPGRTAAGGYTAYQAVEADADRSPFGDQRTPYTNSADYAGTCQPSATEPTVRACANLPGRGCLTDQDCALPFDATSGVVKVTPDRACAAWLSCRTARSVTVGGVTKRVCLDVQGCEALDDKGNCQSAVLGDAADRNLTYSAGSVDQLQNRAGYSNVGFDWGNWCAKDHSQTTCTTDAACGAAGPCVPRLVQGYLSPAYMPQVGQQVALLNGDFESATPSGNPSGWSGWANGDNFRAIDNPLSAQQAGVSYPLEGKKLLEVNAGHVVPDVGPGKANANLSGYIPVGPNTTYIISAYLNTLRFTGQSVEVRVYEYDSQRREYIAGVQPGPQVPLPGGGVGSYEATLNLGPGFDWTLRTDKFTTHPDSDGAGPDQDTRYVRLQLAWNAPGACTGEASRSCLGDGDCSGVGTCDFSKVAAGRWYVDDLKIQPALQVQKNERAKRVCQLDASVDCTNNSNLCAGKGACGPYVAPDFPAQDYERGLETLDYRYASQSCRLYPDAGALSCRYTDDQGLRHRGKYGYCLEWDPQNASYCLQWWPVDSVFGEDADEDQAGYNDRVPLYYCTNAETETYQISSEISTYQSGSDYTGTTAVTSVEKDLPVEAICFDQLVERGGANSWCDSRALCTGRHCVTPADKVTSGDGYDDAPDYSPDQFEAWSLHKGFDRETGHDSRAGRPNAYDWYASSGNWAELWAIVNKNTRTVDHYSWRNVDDADNTNDPAWPGRMVYTRSCRILTQVVTPVGENQAYASRVVQGSTYRVPTFNYTRSVDYPPFGGVVSPPPADDPTLWDAKAIPGTQPLYVEPPAQNLAAPYQARAGSPYSCVPPDPPPPAGVHLCPAGSPTTYADAVKLLNNLFIRSYGVWQWQTDRYVDVTANLAFPGLVTPTRQCGTPSGTRNDRASDPGPDACAVAPQVPLVLLNNADQAVTTNRTGTVTLSFTAVADPDQEPLTEYLVDWGDGVVTRQSGLRLRSRPSRQNAISLLHTYSYPDIAKCDRDASCPGSSRITCTPGSPGTCTVRPRVQVIDNWGWCNGDYAGATDPHNALIGKSGYAGQDCYRPTGPVDPWRAAPDITVWDQ